MNGRPALTLRYCSASEVFLRFAFFRTWSAVLVQVKWWARSLQPSIKARILELGSRTVPKVPRWMAWRSMIENQPSRAAPPPRGALRARLGTCYVFANLPRLRPIGVPSLSPKQAERYVSPSFWGGDDLQSRTNSGVGVRDVATS